MDYIEINTKLIKKRIKSENICPNESINFDMYIKWQLYRKIKFTTSLNC